MRQTKKASVWPVGLVGSLYYERPILDEKGVVVGWSTGWRPERPFAVDMAGFAINLKLILDNPDAMFSFEVPRGYQESTILGAVITKEELEPKADMCSKVSLDLITFNGFFLPLIGAFSLIQVYVWHTRTENPKLNKTAIELQSKLSKLEIEV
jgi:galactosylgalactosylxylosylprotein 3-beta-glucuronosyltransferase 3